MCEFCLAPLLKLACPSYISKERTGSRDRGTTMAFKLITRWSIEINEKTRKNAKNMGNDMGGKSGIN